MRRARLIASSIAIAALMCAGGSATAQAAAEANQAEAPTAGGPVRLRQVNPAPVVDDRMSLANLAPASVPRPQLFRVVCGILAGPGF